MENNEQPLLNPLDPNCPLIQDEQISSKAWWDYVHKNKYTWFLGNSSGEESWANLGVGELVTNHARVLNIGTGTGRCTRDLLKRGCVVDILEISEFPLVDLMDDVNGVFLAHGEYELPVNEYDLVLCYRVAQHMSDKDLTYQIKQAITSLKPTGVFAIQIASRLDNVNTGDDLKTCKSGGVCRTAGKMTDMITGLGGKIVNTLAAGVYDTGASWTSFHIKA